MVEALYGLAALPTRPPTPPKDVDLGIIDRTPSNTSFHIHLAKNNLNTPDESPSSSADYFDRSAYQKPKRVGFSPWIDYKPPAKVYRGTWELEQQIRSIPPSKECRSSKSILKSCHTTVQSDGDLLITRERSFPEMLDDLCRELASTSRSSRMDAYMTLNSCLKAYKDIPDVKALEDKTTLFADFLRRDLSIEIGETEMQNVQLMTQALKLATTLLWIPRIATILQQDFCVFLLDRSISMIEDASTTKTLVNHFMHLLATQNFGPKITTSEKVNRLLDCLQEITARIKGNGVVGQRLVIYRRLLFQARPLMVTRVSDWIDHLFSGMLSTIREIRSRALTLGMEAASTFGSVSQVSRAVQDIFNRRSPEGVIFLQLLLSRLNGMISSRDECLHVPQIWTIVILFLRSRRSQLEQWEHMKDWLGIIQRCFNSSDSQVKLQASIAWNRFVFAVNPNITTGQSMIKMLRQPIIAQLDRKNARKQLKQGKQVAYSSYCNLLYYAFKPGATHAQIDRFWQEYIEPILPGNISTAKIDTELACQILISLLGDSHQKIWNDNRANEEGFIRPEELPRVDPKWTRQRAAMILKVFDSIFASIDWRSVDSENHHVFQAWRGFTKALGEAGSKEVKVSMECMRAVAQIMNSIKRFWLQISRQPLTAGESQKSTMLLNMIALISGATTDIGMIAFTEKRLVQSSQELFEATETPSSRPSRYHGNLASPIVHLMEILSTALQGPAFRAFKIAINALIQLSLRCSSSRRSKLIVFQDMLHLTKTETLPIPIGKLILWQSIVESLELTLNCSHVNDNTVANPQRLGQDCKEIVAILGVGLQQGFIPTQSWSATVGSIVTQIRQEIGAGGIILAIIEPLTDIMGQECCLSHYDVSLQFGFGILNNVVWPESRKEMEHAHRSLYGLSAVNGRVASANPYNCLYTFIDLLLVTAYGQNLTTASGALIDFLEGLSLMIASCPASFSEVLLQRTQRGLALWIEDRDGLIDGRMSTSKRIRAAIQTLWKSIGRGIEKFPKFNTTSLSATEVLISASLSSRHKSILNESVTLWNNTFGLSPDIEYSEDLLRILLRLDQIVDIMIPNSGTKANIKHDFAPFYWIDTQEEMEATTSQQPVEYNSISQAEIEGTSMTPPAITENMIPPPQDKQFHSTPETSPTLRISKLTPMHRLRHDNSQIEFAAIESSPSDLEALESQFLTVHQKEVRERQQRECSAIFPDIMSSSKQRPRVKGQLQSRLSLNSRRTPEKYNVADETTSPSLPSMDVMMDAFTESSPTPKPGRHATSDPLQQNGPPSSPPISNYSAKISQILKTPPSLEESIAQDQEIITRQKVSTALTFAEKHGNEHAKITEKSSSNANVTYSSPQAISTQTNAFEIVNHEVEDQENLPEDGTCSSEIEIFMDAPSSLNRLGVGLSKSADQHFTSAEQESCSRGEVLHQTDPRISNKQDLSYSQDNGSTEDQEERPAAIVLNDDEQISAQIAIDMERALSQATQDSSKSPQVPSPNNDGKKKRNLSSISPSSSIKKQKTDKGVHVVIERRVPTTLDQEILDCIVVAPQPIEDRHESSIVEAFKDEQLRKVSKVEPRPMSSLGLKRLSAPCEKESFVREESAQRSPMTPDKEQKHYSKSNNKRKFTSDVAPSSSSMDRRRSPRFRQVPCNNGRRAADHEEHASPRPSVEVPTTTMVGLPLKDKTVEFIEAMSALDGDPGSENEKQGFTQSFSHIDHDTRELAQIVQFPSMSSAMLRKSERADGGVTKLAPVYTPLSPPEVIMNSQTNPTSLAAASRLGVVVESPTETDIIPANDQEMPVSAETILDQLKILLRDAKHVRLTAGEGRDIMSAWIALGSELNEASSWSVG